MAAPTARYDKGTFTRVSALNESNMLVESVSFDPSREEKEWKDITTDAVALATYVNPTCTWNVKGSVTASSGFVTQHIGTACSSLANFASATSGFDPAVGTLTFRDAKKSWSIGELCQLDMTVKHHPLIA